LRRRKSLAFIGGITAQGRVPDLAVWAAVICRNLGSSAQTQLNAGKISRPRPSGPEVRRLVWMVLHLSLRFQVVPPCDCQSVGINMQAEGIGRSKPYWSIALTIFMRRTWPWAEEEGSGGAVWLTATG
jgi:hypothetical protein